MIEGFNDFGFDPKNQAKLVELTIYAFSNPHSRSRPGGSPSVDVAVEAIDSESFFQAMAELSEQVEREVDLVELSKCLFADRIREQGILWKSNGSKSSQLAVFSDSDYYRLSNSDISPSTAS